MYLVSFTGSSAWEHVFWSINTYAEVRRIRRQAAKIGVRVHATRHW